MSLSAAQPAAQYIPLNERQTLVFIEGENFTVSSSASSLWEPRAWAHSPNYYASTVANVFHSRRAYLHHPALTSTTSAAGDVAAAAFVVPAHGPHEVMVRYEAPFRFEIPFQVTVVQGGKTMFSEVFGRRTNLKIWGFQSGRSHGEYLGCGAGLNTECPWPWGSTENMVWETQTAHSLDAGPAEIRLSPVRDMEYCCWGDINIDAILLHPNATAVNASIYDTTVKDLPFDGMFSQKGEVFFKIENMDQSRNISVGVPLTYDHAIDRGYRHHLNGTSFRTPFNIIVPPGGKTGWLDVGGWMDTLQHGSWQISCDALGPPAPPPPNLTECVLNVQKWCKIDPENKTSCSSCVAGLMISSCPAGCVSHSSHGYECASKSMLQACVPPPTVQELQCEAVVKAKCAQNRTGGHSYAANYTKCLACMKVLPCPAACHDTPIGKCQPAWFEKGCKGLEPPRPPKPTKPGCANGFAGHGFGGPCAPVLGPAHCQIQVGVREHPFATKLADGVPVYEGEVIPVPGRSLFDSIETGTEMLFDVNTRATRRMRHNQDDFEEVVAQLKAQGPVPGKPPSIVPIYSTTFPFNGSDTSSSGTGPARLNYVQARNAMVNEFCAVNRSCLCGEPGGCDTDQSRAATYANLLLEDYVLAAKTQVAIDMGIARVANMSLDVRLRVSTMKLADEIGINGALNDTSFKSWCTQSGVTLSDLGCTAWTKCPFSPNFANATANKKLYYWSNIADHVKGIEKVKGSFEQLKALLPNAKLGANWAPGARYKALDGTARAHHYVGWTFQWINVRHATLYLEKALCTVPTYF